MTDAAPPAGPVGSVAGGAVVDGAVVDGAVVDGAVVDGAVVDGAVVDGAVAGTPPAVSTRRRIWRGAARVIALVALAMTVMIVTLAIGMRRNDAAIDDNYGTTTATVLTVSPLRTGIEFVDRTGATVRPENGVLYPGLLAVGQQFVVEYSTENPQIVRVAGRTAGVGDLMLVLALVIAYLVAAPLIWLCLRRARLPLLGFRRGPGHAAAAAGASGAAPKPR